MMLSSVQMAASMHKVPLPTEMHATERSYLRMPFTTLLLYPRMYAPHPSLRPRYRCMAQPQTPPTAPSASLTAEQAVEKGLQARHCTAIISKRRLRHAFTDVDTG
jgi:hypothetical protein